MREPGNMSGVSRVTFPTQSGSYVISYIRTEKNETITLAQISVPIVISKDPQNTIETESYSPKYFSMAPNNLFSNTKNYDKTWISSNAEPTGSLDLSKLLYLNSLE